MRRTFLMLLVLTLAAFTAQQSLAVWDADGVPLAPTLGSQTLPAAVADDDGGAIAVWEDSDEGNLYAQRIDRSGERQWTDAGVAVETNPSNPVEWVAVSDGAGGVVVAWLDPRSGLDDVYAQRIDASGTPLWTADGVLIGFGNVGDRDNLAICADGTGGAIVAWDDDRSGVHDVYVQRIDGAGVVQWTPTGELIGNAGNNQLNPAIAEDGSGGAIVAWEDERFSPGVGDVYAQRVNAAGVAQWLPGGAIVASAANEMETIVMLGDGAGGATVAWSQDQTGANDWRVYAERLDASGQVLWDPLGFAGQLVAGSYDSYPTAIVPDGEGGTIIVFIYSNIGTEHQMRAQRISYFGARLWADGNDEFAQVSPLYNSDDFFLPVGAVSDGDGGAMVTWWQFLDIVTQRIDRFGNQLWGANGEAVVTQSAYPDDYASVATTDGALMTVWGDTRISTHALIYANRLEPNEGEWGRPDPILSSAADVPNDQGGVVKVNWIRSDRDRVNQDAIEHYTVWRATETFATNIPDAAAGALSTFADVRPEHVAKKGDAPLRVLDDGYFWELVGTQEAVYSPGYALSVATNYDSVSVDPAIHYFQIVAHGDGQNQFYCSGVASAYSVDNLAPAAPMMLTAQRLGGDDVLLEWNPNPEPDFQLYAVYRKGTAGVTPEPLFFLDNATDTTLVDGTATSSNPFHYIVTAFDVHENESVPSNEAMVDGSSTSAGSSPPAALIVRGNFPNPFGASTDIRFSLPSTSDVTLAVYDVRGRLVVERRLRGLAEGANQLLFDARDASGGQLPTGVYFYSLSTQTESVVRKMVITR